MYILSTLLRIIFQTNFVLDGRSYLVSSNLPRAPFFSLQDPIASVLSAPFLLCTLEIPSNPLEGLAHHQNFRTRTKASRSHAARLD
mmetsp:Transcript_26196/g.39665  ORF Transcript_26196/g.39665 Transcript_26196/m.39665 type:complete len:86 (+) Transcript_26196:49-306(+)